MRQSIQRVTICVALVVVLGCGCSPISRRRARADFLRHKSDFERAAVLLQQSRIDGRAVFVGPTFHEGETRCRARREIGAETGGQVLDDQTKELCPLVEAIAINAGMGDDGVVWFCTWSHGAIGNDGGFVRVGSASIREKLIRKPGSRTWIRPIEGVPDWLEWEHDG